MNQAGGIFDQKVGPSAMRPEAKPTNVVPIRKEDFKSPAELAAEASSAMRMAPKSKQTEHEAKQQEIINKINSAVGDGSEKENNEALEELNKITEEELKMAESMIFNGYAEMNISIPNFKNHTITVCTTTPDDIDIVDEILFDMIQEHEDKETKMVNLSDNVLKSARNMFSLCLGYKGMDGTDVQTEKTCQLNIIKKAIESLYRYESEGNIAGMTAMKKDIKQAIKKRAYMLRKIPTPMIDFISKSKYEFDQKMFAVMNAKNLISK